jgi:hypothetical protein
VNSPKKMERKIVKIKIRMAGAISLDHRCDFFEHISWIIVITYVFPLLLKPFLESSTRIHNGNFKS